MRCLWKVGIPLELKPGNQLSSEVDLGYTKLFCVAVVTSGSLYMCDSVLGTLWSSIKQIMVPYVVDWEHGIAVHAMQGNRASSRGEGEDSRIFSSCAGTWLILSS